MNGNGKGLAEKRDAPDWVNAGRQITGGAKMECKPSLAGGLGFVVIVLGLVGLGSGMLLALRSF